MARGQFRFICKCGKPSSGRQCRECFCKKGTSASKRRCMRNYHEKTTNIERLQNTGI